MKPSLSALYVWFCLGFLAIIGAFSASTAIARRSSSLDDALFVRYETAIPRTRAIATARAELREMEVLLLELLPETNDATAAARSEAMARARSAVDASVTSFLAFPVIVDHPAIREQTRAHLADLDVALTEVIDHPEGADRAGRVAAATERARPLIDRLDSDLTVYVSTDAAVRQELALELHGTQKTSLKVLYLLDALAAIISCALAFFILMRLRHHARLEGAYERILEVRAKELEGFADRVAHDVLSPLASVALALSAARRASSEREGEDFSSIVRGERSLRRVQSLVDGLLQFARADGICDRSASCDGRPIVLEILDEARSQNPSFTFEADGVPEFAPRCAAGVLASILLNLLGNAAKYTAGSPVERVSLRVERFRDSVMIGVQDSGPGLRLEDEEVVFLPNVRSKATADKPGIGLGLATVKRLVEAHRGRVGLRSTPGEGLLVWFCLPCAPEPEETDRVAEAMSPGPYH